MRERITVMSSMENDQFMASLPETTEQQKIRDRLNQDMARFFAEGGEVTNLPPMTCKNDEAQNQSHRLQNPELRTAPDTIGKDLQRRNGVIEEGSRTQKVLKAMKVGDSKSPDELEQIIGIAYSRFSTTLHRMIRSGFLAKDGEGRSAVWTRIA